MARWTRPSLQVLSVHPGAVSAIASAGNACSTESFCPGTVARLAASKPIPQ
jgi:hypothetical protein